MAYQDGQYTTMGVSAGAMVGPVGAAVGLIVGLGMDLIIGSQERRKAEEAMEDHMEKLRDNAVISQSYQNSAMNLQHQMFEKQAADEKIDTQISALKIASRSQMSAGESGVQGKSINAELRDVFGQASRAGSKADQNVKQSGANLSLSKQRGNAGVNSQIAANMGSSPGVNYGAILGATVAGGTQVADSYQSNGGWGKQPKTK